MNDFEKVESVIDLTDVLSHYGVDTSRNPTECPFHVSDNKMSFSFNDQVWNCFYGKCVGGGNLFQFIQEKENCDIHEALKKAAEIAGIELNNDNVSQEQREKVAKEREHRKRRVDVLTAATEIFHQNLTKEQRVKLWEERGWNEDTICKFKIGYSCEDIKQKLIEKGFKEGEIEGGLTIYNHNFFNNRIVFSYTNNGLTQYMIGRQTDETPKNKYEECKYKKLKVDYLPNVLFNTQVIRSSTEELFVTEGMADCISIDQAGVPCISPVTIRFKKEDHPKILKYSRGKTVFIANDNEENNSGEKGSIDTATYLFENGVPNVKIITIPKPNDVKKIDMCDYLKDKEDGKASIEDLKENHSKHILDYLIDKIKDEHDFNNITEVLELMSKNTSIPLDSFLKNFSKKTKISASNAEKKIKEIIKKRNETEKQQKLLEEQAEKTKELEKRLEEKEISSVPSDSMEILKREDLLDLAVTHVQENYGVVGETNTLKTVITCQAGCKVKNAKTASFNQILNSKSGSGKDFLAGATAKLWSNDICIKRTRISPTAFTYWHNARFEPEWTWDGKILILEDVSETVLNSDTFKVMQSSGSTATIVINNRACDINIKGKPVMIITTAKSSPNIELLRRNSLCQLDESEEHTKDILMQQAREAEKGKTRTEELKIEKALEYLKRVDVRVPFAEKFVIYFPSKHLIMRTAFNRFVDMIRASAALHQYQRERDSEGYILANGQDYDIAREILEHLTKDGNMIPITRDQESIINVIKSRPKDSWLTVEDIVSEVPIHDKWTRILLDRMTEAGLLEVSGIKNEISNKTVKNYKLAPITNLVKLKSFKEIMEGEVENGE